MPCIGRTAEKQRACLILRAAELGAGTSAEALAWMWAGDAYHFLPETDRAISAYERAARLFLRLNDATGESLSRFSRGRTLLALERWDEVLSDLRHAAQLFI